MKPRGALMIEHRLIEKVLYVLKDRIEQVNIYHYDPLFTDIFTDFIRTYADRTHHGKEENILFRELSKKSLDKKDEALMQELIEDHKKARENVKKLIEYNDAYKSGYKNHLQRIIKIFEWLISFYPEHIKKEDDVFFPGTEKYFSAEEQDKLLAEYWEFDRKMIHEKYQNVYKSLAELKWTKET